MDEKKEVVIHGYKGFDKNMQCRGFQFEEGKEYECEDAIICEKGFHFCENPLDVWDYYGPSDGNLFAEVTGSGMVVDHNKDSKKSSTKIKINAKLSLAGFIKASVDFLLSKSKEDKNVNAASGNYSKLAASGNYSKLAASGDSSKLAASGDSSQLAASGNYSKLAASGNYSKLAASGNYSKLAASGDSSQLAASGNYSKLAASGDSSKLAASGDSSKLEMSGADSVGASIGIGNTIKGVTGCWITLAEWEYDKQKKRYIPVCVKSAQIDGKTIKADTWYCLNNGEFVAVE